LIGSFFLTFFEDPLIFLYPVRTFLHKRENDVQAKQAELFVNACIQESQPFDTDGLIGLTPFEVDLILLK